MKKRLLPLLLAALLLLAGCGAQDNHLEWPTDWTRADDLLAVETPEGFLLTEYNPTFAANGIWYMSWAAGEERNVTNTEGNEASAYDAQIYLLVMECGSAEDAEAEVSDWLAREAQNYEAGEVLPLTGGGQAFRALPLLSAHEGNPYSHGMAVFGTRGALAISVELLCAEDFEGDAQAVLTRFLGGIHYGDQEE